jgi:hypothetical protein
MRAFIMVSGVDGADYTVREMIIEMRGTVNRTADDVASLRSNQDNLAQRIGTIERDNAFNRGQKSGFERAVKAVYALATVSGIGGIAAAFKILLMH